MSKNPLPGVDSRAERETFAKNFRRARMKLGLTQRAIRELTGIAQSHISEIEAGVSNIAFDTMVKLAVVVKQPLWQLFRPDGPEDDKPLPDPRSLPRNRTETPIDLTLNGRELRALKKAADKAGLTVDDLVRKALRDTGLLPQEKGTKPAAIERSTPAPGTSNLRRVPVG